MIFQHFILCDVNEGVIIVIELLDFIRYIKVMVLGTQHKNDTTHRYNILMEVFLDYKFINTIQSLQKYPILVSQVTKLTSPICDGVKITRYEKK